MTEEHLQFLYSHSRDLDQIKNKLEERISKENVFSCSVLAPREISFFDTQNIIETFSMIGLRRTRTRKRIRNIQFHFERPLEYIHVERERQRLGYYGQNPCAPLYSVCVCNYNMDDTLEVAMTSVIEQLDPKKFEVLVVDDGSTDNSVAVLKKLANRYENFRFIPLVRDRRRKLGWTRNISIRAARGQYVLLHIDTDDLWEPYLQVFVDLFHKLEAALGKDFHLSGQQTGIGKRDFLLRFGPFDNIYRCEDRNLMMKLANRGLLIFMDYSVFRTRLSRPKDKKFKKSWVDLVSQMLFELRQRELSLRYFKTQILGPFRRGPQSFSVRLIRALMVTPLFLVSRFYEVIENEMSWSAMREYHEANRGNFQELMDKLGADPSYEFQTQTARDIFLSKEKAAGFSSLKSHDINRT